MEDRVRGAVMGADVANEGGQIVRLDRACQRAGIVLMTRGAQATCMVMVAASLLSPGAVMGQRQASTPRPGDQVRITAPSHNLIRQRGLVVEAGADTLVVRLPDGGAQGEPGRSLSVPVSAITDLDVSLGRKSRLQQGLLIGMAAGSVIGAIAGTKVDCSGYDQGLCVAYLGVSGAAAGGLLGAAVGAAIRTERWTEVRLDPGGRREGFAWRLEVRLALSR